jgi:hypothetical protein
MSSRKHVRVKAVVKRNYKAVNSEANEEVGENQADRE